MNWLRAAVLLFSLASVGAQLVPAQLPVIQSDASLIAPPPIPVVAADPFPAVADPLPVVADEQIVEEVPLPGEEEPEALLPPVKTNGNTGIVPPRVVDRLKRRLTRGGGSDDHVDRSRGHFHKGGNPGHGHKDKPRWSNRRNRRHSDDDDDHTRRPRRGRKSHRHGSSSGDDDDDGTPTTRRNPGDLRDLVGAPCANSYSEGKCKYLAAQGLCSSTVSSHVGKAWRGCRQTCNLCRVPVPDCLPGFRFNQVLKTCVDIDECAEKSATCVANSQCVNKDGYYKCVCKDGFVGNGKTLCQVHCADASAKCSKYSGQCQLPALRIFLSKVCPVTCGVCSLRCARGYKLGKDGNSCVNVNECLENKSNCPEHSTCIDNDGSYACSCHRGYTYNVNTKTCVEYCNDVRTDCATTKSQCSAGTSLQQAWMGTHCAATCQVCGQPPCPRGYQSNADGQCVDVNECSSPELNNCAANANCFNTVGSYSCVCQKGYKGNGFVKCTTDTCFDLHHQYRCKAMKKMGICNSRDRYQCAQTCRVCSNDDPRSCSKGYAPKHGVCLDVNECKAQTHRCPSNSRCINAFGGYRCKCDQGYSPTNAKGQWKCVRENTCYVAGDPHLLTFDGQLISVSSKCRYVLARPAANKLGILTDFLIVIETEHRDGDLKTTWIRSVQVTVFNQVITIGKRGRVQVNGEHKAVPYTPTTGVSITRNGRDVIVYMDNGVHISFDGVQQVKVSVPNSYKKKMTGLCGNLDDNAPNDLITAGGLRTPSHATIGNSWAVPDPIRPCLPATDEDNHGCSKQNLPQVSGKGQCGILKDPRGPFAECIQKVNPSYAFEACVTDLCKSSSTLCRHLQVFADRCQTEGVTVTWRSSTLCPLPCGANSTYSPAMSACPATCANPSSEGTCTSLPQEGCACNAGMVRDGFQKCIPVTQCGCQLNGVYHSTGDTWYDDTCSYKFTCMEQSTILKVPSTCLDSGTCQTKNGTVACYCNDQASGTFCDEDAGYPQVTPNDPDYNPTAPLLPPNAVQLTTTTPGPTVSTTPAYIPPHPDGEIADDEYFNAPPPPPPPPKARPLGVESGIIPDEDIKPSSSSPTDPPSDSRPNSRNGWSPHPSDTNPHITYDMGSPMDIHGIGTLGHYKKPCWVTFYNVYVSNDGVTFTPLTDTRPEYSTQPRNFVGNFDQNTWKKHCLHQYYGKPVTTRFIRFVLLASNGCFGLRVELYGFRDGRDPKLIQALQNDQWTKNTTGCLCYFDHTSTDCACCQSGGCQCPRSNLHQCVQCGYSDKCGTPEIKKVDEQMDPYTLSPTGCQCCFDPTSYECACCTEVGCQCGSANKNQCVTCGHKEHCGQKEQIFGPSETCVPKTCPGK